jgi:hypothetical protein
MNIMQKRIRSIGTSNKKLLVVKVAGQLCLNKQNSENQKNLEWATLKA